MADTLIDIQNISFSYFEDEYEDETETTVKTTETKVFDNISLQIPSGVTSLIGQNGTGKSTLMLLSAGILQPDNGKIFLAGHNTADIADEEKRQHLVSFVYQNMEFETEEDIGTLLKFVYQNGFHKDKNDGLLDELIEVCQLQDVLSRPLQNVSKGESQRVIVAFSLLYGTPIVMMDEPVFACEDYQKHKIFGYLRNYAQKYGVSILFSAHELELSEQYSDYLVLFYRTKPPVVGATKELFTPKTLEEAYEAPYSMLKVREGFYRESLGK